MNCSMLGFPVLHHILELAQTLSIESVMLSNHLVLCCPLLLLPSIFPSNRVFSSESVLRISGQSIGVSASASVLPMNIEEWFPLRWTGSISLQSKGLSRVFSNTTVQRHQFLVLSLLYGPILTTIHKYWKKNIVWITWIFLGKVMSVLFNMLSSITLVIPFFQRAIVF